MANRYSVGCRDLSENADQYFLLEAHTTGQTHPRPSCLVEAKVSTGYYKSASEVIREGLRLLAERDDIVALKHQAIRAKIAEGIEQADAGTLVDGEEAVVRVRSKIDEC